MKFHLLLTSLLLSALPAAADFVGPYQLQNFAKSNFTNMFATGSTTLTPPVGATDTAVFGYSIATGGIVPETLGTLSATAAESGTISFDYDYAGFHAFFQARAQFQVLVNGSVVLNLVDNQSVSSTFNFSGSASFAVQQGDTFAFRVGGRHSDSNGNLNGSLTLTNFFQNIRTVTSTADSGPGSLRQVIGDAPPLASILFDPAVFPGGADNTIDLASQLSIPNKTLEINARSVGGVTLDAGGTSRCISNTSGGTLSLDSLGITGGSGGNGGGVANTATLRLASCAVFGNSAIFAGGGIVNLSEGVLEMINCTVFDNTAEIFSGGVENNGAASTATLIHCTIFNNSAADLIGGVGNGGHLTLSHTVIAGNSSPSDPDIRAPIVTFTGPNFIGDNSDTGYAAGFPNGDGNYVGTSAAPLDPGLLPFGDYGGATPTLLPRFDSPLIDLGIASAATPFTDQRGLPRNSCDAPDLGAVEAGVLATTPPVAFIDNINGPADNLTVSQAGEVNLTNMKPGNLLSQGAHIDGRNTDFDFTTGSTVGLPGIPFGTTLFPSSRVSGLRVTVGALDLTEAPTSFLLYGLRGDGTAEFIADGALPEFDANFTSHTVFLPQESAPYPAFRLRFPTNGGNPIITLAGVELLGRPEMLVGENYATAWFTVKPPGKQLTAAWPAQPFADTLVQSSDNLSFNIPNFRPQNLDGDAVASINEDFSLVGDRQFIRAANEPPLLLLDVDGFDAPAGETENGFTRLTDPALNGDTVNTPVTLTASAGGVTVTVANGNQFRDLGYAGSASDPNSLGTQAFPHLLRDFIELDKEGSSLDVTITGLPTGLYYLTTFHFDRGVFAADNTFRLEFTDANGTTIGPDLAMPFPTSPIEGVQTIVRSNGVNDVILRIRERGPSNRSRLNGLAITPLAGQ